jgi:hypothetical protein
MRGKDVAVALVAALILLPPAPRADPNHWRMPTGEAGTRPSARIVPVTFYDGFSSLVVYGGTFGTTNYFATYNLDVYNYTWTQLSPATNPPFMSEAAVVLDPLGNQTLCYGGRTPSGASDQLWRYAGGAWSRDSPAGPAGFPPPLIDAHFVYSPSNDRFYLYGGTSNGAPVQNSADLWMYDPNNTGSWTRVAYTGSPPRVQGAAMAYDGVHGRLVLFGGLLENAQANGSTYAYALNSNTWFAVPTSNPPPPVWYCGVGRVPDHTRMWVFGGGVNNSGALRTNGFWQLNFSNNTWTAPNLDRAPPPGLTIGTFNYADQFAMGVAFGGGTDTATGVHNQLWYLADFQPEIRDLAPANPGTLLTYRALPWVTYYFYRSTNLMDWAFDIGISAPSVTNAFAIVSASGRHQLYKYVPP